MICIFKVIRTIVIVVTSSPTSASYVKSDAEFAAKPLSATLTMTGKESSGPLPTEHVILVVVEPVTVHATSPIVTVFSLFVELNPVPVSVRVVL